MFKRILVPVDGSPTSDQALAAALRLARSDGARVRLVHAYDELPYLTGYEISPELVEQTRGHAEQVLRDALRAAADAHVPADTRLLDAPGRHLGEQVADQARDFGADLIVVGTHGRRGLGRVLLGSGAEQIIRMAPVPVLTTRGEAMAAGTARGKDKEEGMSLRA